MPARALLDVVHGEARAAGRVAVVLGLLFGLAGSGTSAVAVALPQLAAGLGVDTAQSAWVISAYAVALAVTTAVYGRVADLVGIRRPLVFGVLLMAGGALLATLAPTFPLLVAGRVLQGAGAGAAPVLGTALVSARWSGATKSSALGRVAGAAATLATLGPVIGGALAAAGGWRWTLALPVVSLATLPMIWRAAPTTGTRDRFDVTGAFLVASAAAGLVLLIQSPAAGLSVAAVGAGLLTAAVPAASVWVRARPGGFLPRAVLTNGVVLRSAVAAAAVPAAWFALLVAVPITLAARGWEPLGIGLTLLPATLAALTMPRVTRVLLPRLGATRALTLACPLAGMAMLVAALGAAAGVPALLMVAVVLVTGAFGLGQPAMVEAVGSAVDEAQRGVALGTATLIFLVGAGVGSATVGGLAGLLGTGGALAVLALVPAGGSALLLPHAGGGSGARPAPARAAADTGQPVRSGLR